jgi:hypothetical protein
MGGLICKNNHIIMLSDNFAFVITCQNSYRSDIPCRGCVE